MATLQPQAPLVPFYQKAILPNGIRVVTERISTTRSASIGVWVRVGSLQESSAEAGLAHFLEHLHFKGTMRRTSREISEEIEGRGGDLNAFTSREMTCYYARVLDDHLPVAIDVLADVLLNSVFDPDELEKEKGVVLEEIKMYQDEPDSMAHDLFAQAVWPGHALGRPVIGQTEVIEHTTRDEVVAFKEAHYKPENIVIAVAGNVQHDQVVSLIETSFGQMTGTPKQAEEQELPATPEGLAIVHNKDGEQVQLVVGFPGLPLGHQDLPALNVINTVLGGGMSARLFQEIREKRGLCYSIYSYPSPHPGGGYFAVGAGTSPATYQEVLGLILGELDRIRDEGLTAIEVHKAKEQIKGEVVLGVEGVSKQASRLGRDELLLGRVRSLDEILAIIDAITAEQVNMVCRQLFAGPRVVAAVGPVGDGEALKRFGFTTIHRA